MNVKDSIAEGRASFNNTSFLRLSHRAEKYHMYTVDSAYSDFFFRALYPKFTLSEDFDEIMFLVSC